MGKKCLFCIVLSVVVLSVLIAGCVQMDNTFEDKADVSGGETSVEPAGPVKITLLMPQHPSRHVLNEEDGFYKEIVKRLNIELDINMVVGSDYQAKKNMIIASGGYPDIFCDETKNLVSYIAEGIIMDIKPLAEQYKGQDILNALKDKKDRYSVSDSSGRLLGVPEINDVIWTNSLIIRKDWLNSLNLSVPQTMDELYQYLKRCKKSDLGGDGSTIPYATRDLSYIGIIESVTDNKNGNLAAWDRYEKQYVCDAISDQYKEGLKFLNKLYSEKLMDNEYATTKTQQWEQKVVSGIVGLTYDNISRAVVFNYAWAQQDPNTTYEAMIVPPLKDSHGNQWHEMFSPVSQNVYAISRKNKEIEKSIEFLNYFFTDEGATILNIGVEGITYEIGESGKPQMLVGAEDAINSFNAPDTTSFVGYKTWQPKEMQAGDLYAPIKEFVALYGNFETVAPPMVYTEEEMNIIGSATSIQKYVETSQNEFIMGGKSFEQWDEYVNKVKEMNIEEIIKVYNAVAKRFAEFK